MAFLDNIEDGDFKIEILDKYIDEYEDKEYSRCYWLCKRYR